MSQFPFFPFSCSPLPIFTNRTEGIQNNNIVNINFKNDLASLKTFQNFSFILGGLCISLLPVRLDIGILIEGIKTLSSPLKLIFRTNHFHPYASINTEDPYYATGLKKRLVRTSSFILARQVPFISDLPNGEGSRQVYPASRGLLIFLDRKMEGPLLTG